MKTVKEIENRVIVEKNILNMAAMAYPTITSVETEIKVSFDLAQEYADRFGYSYPQEQTYGWLQYKVFEEKQGKCLKTIWITSSVKYEPNNF